MPKRKSSTRSRSPLLLGVLATLALLLFGGGELAAWLGSDAGRLALWRHLHLGDRAHAVRIVGARIAEGLLRAGVARGRVREQAGGPDGADMLWTVPLEPEESALRINAAITRAVERGGAEVLRGRERPGPEGALVVALLVGVPGRPTHEVELVRPARAPHARGEPRAEARVALVLAAEDADAGALAALCARAEPFAVAVPADGPAHRTLLAAARAAHRDVVLLAPMEPENYPRVNPGPATLLVSMRGSRIEEGLRRMLAEAGPVLAVANRMGGFATQDEPFMSAVYRELRRARVTFLHVEPVPRAVCKPLAARMGVAYDTPDVALDAAPAKRLDREWSDALAGARARGHALVWVRVTPGDVAWLTRALAPARLAGARLVPAREVLQRPAAP